MLHHSLFSIIYNDDTGPQKLSCSMNSCPVNLVCKSLIRAGNYICPWGHSREQATSYAFRRLSPVKECPVWACVPGETSSAWLEAVMSPCVGEKKKRSKRALALPIHSTYKFQLLIAHFAILLSPFMPCLWATYSNKCVYKICLCNIFK